MTPCLFFGHRLDDAMRHATLNGHNFRAAISLITPSGGNSVMSEFDWRSPETYGKLQSAEMPDFAWECLRRNDDYRNEYRALESRGPPVTASNGFRSRWGLSFRG
jgi:hypothetical protein